MKIHRFYISGDLHTGAMHITEAEFHNQVKNVLRLTAGEPIILFNGTGEEATGTIADVEAHGITVQIAQVSQGKDEPKRNIILYLAVLKNEHFELAAQKAVECGVTEIVPVITARTVKLALKPERVVKILKEAAEQSGRSVIPRLGHVITFEEAMHQARKNSKNIFCDASGTGMHELILKGTKIGVWIGPEGGFTPEEVGAAQKAGFMIASLGSLILRAETAAIVGVYLAAHG